MLDLSWLIQQSWPLLIQIVIDCICSSIGSMFRVSFSLIFTVVSAQQQAAQFDPTNCFRADNFLHQNFEDQPRYSRSTMEQCQTSFHLQLENLANASLKIAAKIAE